MMFLNMMCCYYWEIDILFNYVIVFCNLLLRGGILSFCFVNNFLWCLWCLMVLNKIGGDLLMNR